jgi:Protein of unknown function (DUF1761)
MEISINYGAVILAAIAQFVAGAIWYMPLFGKAWGEIHGFDKKPKKEQEKLQKEMMPLLFVQFILAVIISWVLAHIIVATPDESSYVVAGWLWFGFVLPTQVGAVIFGETQPKWFVKKIAIMAGGSLVNLLLAAWILSSIA